LWPEENQKKKRMKQEGEGAGEGEERERKVGKGQQKGDRWVEKQRRYGWGWMERWEEQLMNICTLICGGRVKYCFSLSDLTR
jgi:hypothetical protein